VVDTPGKHTIDDVSAFLKVPPSSLIKTLIYVWGDQVAAVLVRGDDDVNEVKLAKALGATDLFLAGDAEVERVTGAPVGFAGPVGLKARILADRHVADVKDGVTGANAGDKHLVHVVPGRDFQPEWFDLRSARNGDVCPKCGGSLRLFHGIEAGHTFVLGTHYSAKMGANYLAEDGKEHPLVMGCYGIGVSRLVASAIEQHYDADGIKWPAAIAPYDVSFVPVGAEPELRAKADELYAAMTAAGIDVLLDDRDERPGVKFKDADLIGLPFRLVLGKKGLAGGFVEFRRRGEKENRNVEFGTLVETVRGEIARARKEAMDAADRAGGTIAGLLGL